MKRTPFYEIHQASGAKIVEFAGFEMPIQYSGLIEEHLHVRNAVGVFDVSHMGEIWVRGANAYDLVQYITTNDVSILNYGKIQYSCMPNGKGGIIDDILVYCFSRDEYLLVVNASNIQKDWNWISSQNLKFGAALSNKSDDTAQLAIQGPQALHLLQSLTEIDLSTVPYYQFVIGHIAGIETLISNTGYTGAGGFELYVPNALATALWEAIFTKGKAFDPKPIGLGARDTLRLEKGYCLYGNDIDDTTSPIEAGLAWITKFVPNNDFLERDKMQAIKLQGPKRLLRGFRMIDRGIPRHDYTICDSTGQIIGKVTSGTQSPMLQCGIGMGYVNTDQAEIGNQIYISIREKLIKAEIVKMPFWNK
jgi:aminomethyltransferase